MDAQGEPLDSAGWLAKAKAAYCFGVIAKRDALLECGRALHQFILAFLRERAQAVDQQKARGFIRRKATRIAAEALAVPPDQIGYAIHGAAVVDLLGDGDPGGLAWNSILAFGRFVGRKPGERRPSGWGDLLAGEEWSLRDGIGAKEKALFRQTAEEAWPKGRIRDYIRDHYPPMREDCRRPANSSPNSSASGKTGTPSTPEPRSRESRSKEQPPPLPPASVKVASPGDVAEMCLELVHASADPWATAQRLIPDLQRIPRPRGPFQG